MIPHELLTNPLVWAVAAIGGIVVVFLYAAARAAGDEVGRAAIAEAAPAVAGIVPQVFVRLVVWRLPDQAQRDLEAEIGSLVEAHFAECSAPSESVRAMIRVMMNSISLARFARGLRASSLSSSRHTNLTPTTHPPRVATEPPGDQTVEFPTTGEIDWMSLSSAIASAQIAARNAIPAASLSLTTFAPVVLASQNDAILAAADLSSGDLLSLPPIRFLDLDLDP